MDRRARSCLFHTPGCLSVQLQPLDTKLSDAACLHNKVRCLKLAAAALACTAQSTDFLMISIQRKNTLYHHSLQLLVDLVTPRQ